MNRRCSSAAVFLAALALAPPVRAQATATAVGLFKQGRELTAQGKYAEACPLFAEAHRLEPNGVGITLNLAECDKHIGKTASAWNLYNEAEFRAKKDNDSAREKFAHDEAAALEPRLSRLRINAGETPGLAVRLDDAEFARGLWGTTFPIDPGEHKIEATAPGYAVWAMHVKVGPERDLQIVEVPTLLKAAAPWGARRLAGVAVGGLGVAGLITGAVFGGLTFKKVGDAKGYCNADRTSCAPTGVTLMHDAKTTANVSNAALVIGGAALVAGVVLFVTAPAGGAEPAPKSGARMTIGPVAGPGMTGALIQGRW